MTKIWWEVFAQAAEEKINKAIRDLSVSYTPYSKLRTHTSQQLEQSKTTLDVYFTSYVDEFILTLRIFVLF